MEHAMSERSSQGGWVLGKIAALIGPLLFASAACGPDTRTGQISAAVVVQDKAVMKYVRAFAIGIVQTTNKKNASVACADFPSKYRTVVQHPDLRFEATSWITWSGQEAAATEVLEVRPDEQFIVAVEGQAPYNQVQHVVARGCAERVTSSMGSIEIDVRATAGRPCSNDQQCERTLGRCYRGDGFPAQGYCGVANCAADNQCPPGSACVYVGQGAACAAICDKAEDCETGNGVGCVRSLGPGGCHGACLKPNSPHQEC
jgi:hypothetical protein